MARIKKVTKINKGINLCNEEVADKKFQRSLLDMNSLNSKKLCNNERNRRILLNLKSYPNFFLANNFSNNLLPLARKNSISISTQTNDEMKTMSTQTNLWREKDKKIQETKINLVRQTKSDCSLVQHSKLYSKNRLNITKRVQKFSENDKIKQFEDNEINKNITVFHKKENRDNPNEISELNSKLNIGNIKKLKIKKCNKRTYKKKIAITKFHSYKIIRKSRQTKEMEKTDAYTYIYQQFIKRIGNYSLTAVAKCSSKLIKIFSDLGLSLTESLTNLYKFYESQKSQQCNCQDFNPKIDQLMLKLNEFEENFRISQAKIYEQQMRIDNTYELIKNLENVTKQLESSNLIKTELSALKENTEITKNISVQPPPPPPLPPLPIFSLTTKCASKTFLKVEQNEKKLISSENSRPLITVEDILNVKLKKISVTNI